MAKKAKTYRELKDELDRLVLELEATTDDIDKAIEQYKKAQKLIDEIEKYLDKAKAKIDILKPPKQP
ncbi:MAG TPA: exodeoxyribonuclease VII small subunit [Candidatus Saccharimonadales bacterium]|nr:exodeoxyribonuclease VII small subunit [Candidatus Saccharimonadales bacterium]